MSRFLKKSFDSAKCKTLLQLTIQKLKILRNKHALAVNSARADVAKLLEKGQDSKAKTQADNVFREENIVALYNLLEHFCQLLINSMERIKSQSDCPSDLKEAVASLIYVSSRCGEVEELKKMSSYLTNKYGTEFFLAAKELRSGCGVNTQVIQNLSSIPPSSDARMKLLKEVAVQNKIDWDYDTSIADTSMQPVLDGSKHSTSNTPASYANTFERRRSESLSLKVNEVDGRTIGVLKHAFSSHTMSPKASVHSPLHTMHQPEKLKASLNPYALAKSQGIMDYKFIYDYKGSEHTEHSISTKATRSNNQSRSPGSSNMCHNNQRMSNAGKEEVERQLLELEAVAKVALESASEAAKAARVAVAMVRQESLGRTQSCRSEILEKQEGRSLESSPVPVFDESSFGRIRGVSRFSPSSDNSATGMVSNSYASEDNIGEDQFKYVVFEQSSGFQQTSSQPAKLDTMLSEYEDVRSTEVRMNPLIDSFHSRDAKEEVDWETSHGPKQAGSQIQHNQYVQNISSRPQFDDYNSEEDLKEETPFFPSKDESSKQQHEDLFDVAEVQPDKDVQEKCSVPQFDDDGTEEASEEETPFYMKGRAAIIEEDYANGTARAPSTKLMSTSPLIENTIEKRVSSEFSDKNTEESLQVDYQGAPSYCSARTDEQAIIEEHLVHSPELTASACSPGKCLKSSSTSKIDATKYGGHGIKSSSMGLKFDNVPSPSLSSLKPVSPTGDCEEENPSSQVRRNLKWCSTEDTEFASESSTEACKPSSPSLWSPESEGYKQSLEELPTPGIQSPPSKYKGMSRRSVRSSRPRQTQTQQ